MKTYKYKLYSNSKKGDLDRIINHCGMVYNYCIALHKRYYKIYHKGINVYQLQKHLTKLKKQNKWLSIMKDIPSQSLQNIAERIDRAYKLFFSNLKKKKRCSPPSFKKLKKYKSFTLKQKGYKFSENRIRIGKKEYGYFKSRKFEGKIKTIVVKRDLIGDFYIFITTDKEDIEVITKSGKSVGYDFGMMTFLTASDYNDIKCPLFLKQAKKKHKKLCQSLSKKKKGSNHRKQSRIQLARFNNHLVNKRNDYQWKLANKLCKTYDTICFETLNIQWMQKNHGKKVGEFGFSDFINKLKYLSKKYDKQLVFIDKYYPSTQICSNCGYKNPLLKDERIREWKCPNCHNHHDRDRNASFNILRVGTSTLSIDTVNPSFEGNCRLTLESQQL